ncbi:hypothetical protein DC3_29670 [Deinococcus cellulosilyticus NBRC 106333 = KACC 11606]|uniref:Uncharacterized protein n=1 Tax=Deinococcus cellulosilyticus (strain DSM 18568 / NBRC 106333 / KACC 11606 / 5516J-15) TaxID=1223518 RepID=A0A511N3B4_DEIC1|nr:hypothetical protein DC3_29670 [Deinococcus cellulosilyticus NBRC 106333 = KACC 11606]
MVDGLQAVNRDFVFLGDAPQGVSSLDGVGAGRHCRAQATQEKNGPQNMPKRLTHGSPIQASSNEVCVDVHWLFRQNKPDDSKSKVWIERKN